jgi:hypothetical protein
LTYELMNRDSGVSMSFENHDFSNVRMQRSSSRAKPPPAMSLPSYTSPPLPLPLSFPPATSPPSGPPSPPSPRTSQASAPCSHARRSCMTRAGPSRCPSPRRHGRRAQRMGWLAGS